MPSSLTTSIVASSRNASSTQLSLAQKASSQQENRHLHPQDAFHKSLPRSSSDSRSRSPLVNANRTISGVKLDSRKRREKRRARSSSRKVVRPWKKLLWVKQSYPDNYTDEETFLDHLQINQRLRPYEFWPLVSDSTIIVQHVCSVVIFVSCFVGIFQERVSPMTVVGWATFGTVVSWLLSDYWQSDEQEIEEDSVNDQSVEAISRRLLDRNDRSFMTLSLPSRDTSPPLTSSARSVNSRPHSRAPSMTSISQLGAMTPLNPETIPGAVTPLPSPLLEDALLSPKALDRATTIKSAVLIYFSLLGLSPILKSLTKSTSSDSIWALSSWLMGINVFTFDYGAGPEAKFPASLSTNAALMASTVLASRLPSTTHVFSLTLFSIEVFGLFPVFRRHLKHHSWTLHLWLTVFLVIMAGGALSMVISGGGLGYAVLGAILGGLITCLSMGLTSWWLIGLQRYKNEIHGPWDPARPVIRRHWD